MLSKFKLNQLYFKDTQFANLMTRRIFNVLLIANPYDASMNIPRSPCVTRRALHRYLLARKRWPNYRPCHTTLSYVCREQEITRDLT